MSKDKQAISIRVEIGLYEKFKVVAEKSSRTISKQIEYLMRQCVEQYESAHGKIIQTNNNNGSGTMNVNNNGLMA